MKNLFALPSVVIVSVLTFIGAADRILEDAITNGEFSLKHKKDLVVCLSTVVLAAYLRYTEDEKVYTPCGLPGRDVEEHLPSLQDLSKDLAKYKDLIDKN